MFTGTSDEVCDTLTKLIPLGRLAKPDEVAAATLFLRATKAALRLEQNLRLMAV